MFPEETILNEPVENWPLCDCLISFHSTDFPLKKAIEYEQLRRPYVLNDLHRQFDLVRRNGLIMQKTNLLSNFWALLTLYMGSL